MLEISIAGRKIFGHPSDLSRAHGLYVSPGGFQGWKGLSNTRREALARAVMHGEHDTPVLLGSRVVTIDGIALAPTEYELDHLTDSFSGLLFGGKERVTVNLWGQVRFADGRVTLAEIDVLGKSAAPYQAEFQLQVTFADPRSYGETNNLPGDTLVPKNPTATATSIPVFHYGNFPGFPEVEIPNAPASYSISSPFGTYAISGATAGGTHRVILRNGRVYRNGVEMPGVGRGALWAVPPGAPTTHTLSVPGRIHMANTFV